MIDVDAAGYCTFKRQHPREEWVLFPPVRRWRKGVLVRELVPQGAPSRRTFGPDSMDAPIRNQPVRRCPACSRRLTMRVVHCGGGEFLWWELPDHKPRETRRPGPKRQSRISGRGK